MGSVSPVVVGPALNAITIVDCIESHDAASAGRTIRFVSDVMSSVTTVYVTVSLVVDIKNSISPAISSADVTRRNNQGLREPFFLFQLADTSTPS